MFKRIIGIALTITIMLTGVCGCMGTKSYTDEEKKELVLNHLKEKYGQEFEGLSYTPKEWGKGGDSFFIKPKNGDGKDGFEVWGRYENGIYRIEDGYFGIYIKPEYEKVMRGFLDEYIKEYKIYLETMTGGSVPQRLNKDTKVSEIYNEHEFFNTDVYVAVKESASVGLDIRDIAMNIAEKKKKNKMVGKISISVMHEDKYIQIKLDRSSWQEDLDPKYETKWVCFEITSDLNIKKYGEK